MKPLIAIMTCHAFASRAQAQRDSWVKDLPDTIDYKFFVGGRGAESDRPDVVTLDCDDGYLKFPLKVQAMRQWALDHGYEQVLKLDDDVMVAVDRMMTRIPPLSQPYVGRLRGPSGGRPAPYCSGFAYWLNRAALETLVKTPWTGDIAEDRFTGNALHNVGISGFHETTFQVVYSKRNALSGREHPLTGNRVSIACEYDPRQMIDVYNQYKSGVLTKYTQRSIANGCLNNVCVVIKTFLRDGMVLRCLDGLVKNFPDMKIVITDDGWSDPNKVVRYSELVAMGHQVVWMPYDSGFGAKANAAIPYCDREYVLIGSDDFDFSDERARPGVIKMKAVLDANPSIDVCSGRVDTVAYESCLEVNLPEVKEVSGSHGVGTVGDIQYRLCDLTVNYSLIRRKVFDTVRWDGGDVKIGGGEHGSFFYDLKQAGFRVAVIDEANIYQMKPFQGCMHPSYPAARRRALEPGRPCLKKRGIERWICQDGRVEVA